MCPFDLAKGYWIAGKTLLPGVSVSVPPEETRIELVDWINKICPH